MGVWYGVGMIQKRLKICVIRVMSRWMVDNAFAKRCAIGDT